MTWQILEGDCREILRTLPVQSVQTCVTSPPYFGLRDYGTGEWEGGDLNCEHKMPSRVDAVKATASSTLVGSTDTQGHLQEASYKSVCGQCGACRVDRQIGLEPTPDEFVAALVEVFREVRRVLRDDGTVWLNLGDSYASDFKGSGGTGKSGLMNDGREETQRLKTADASNGRAKFTVRRLNHGAKTKDLLGIPWMVAFALRADGWYLRSDIIWAKPNPMPESVTDRPTKAHEYLFLLAKGQWKSRVVALADLRSEGGHLRDYVGSNDPHLWAHEFGVRLATAILDRPEFQEGLGLPALDAQVWQQRPGDGDGFRVAGLPVEHRASVLAARLLSTHGTAKEFLCELDRLGVALTQDGELLIGGGAAVLPLPPGVDRYGETAIAIHHPGEVGKLDLAAHAVECMRPGGCSYFYDADAIREDNAEPSGSGGWQAAIRAGDPDRYAGVYPSRKVEGAAGGAKVSTGERLLAQGRNRRSVWTVATQPYSGAHFATFPPKLIEPCILAGTSPKACGECGAPWRRIVERTANGNGIECPKDVASWQERPSAGALDSSRLHGQYHNVRSRTLGWEPSCAHDDDTGRGIVLDPFAGSGTTGVVAGQLQRDFIGIELSPNYATMARDRITAEGRPGQRNHEPTKVHKDQLGMEIP